MATSREYGYFIKGNRIAIVEKDWNYGDGQTLSQPGLNDVGSSGSSLWKSPVATVDNGILLEYTVMPGAKDGLPIANESDDIDINSYLAKALVYYVKSKMAEDAMKIEEKEYFMREFRSMIEKHSNNKIIGQRRVMPTNNAII